VVLCGVVVLVVLLFADLLGFSKELKCATAPRMRRPTTFTFSLSCSKIFPATLIFQASTKMYMLVTTTNTRRESFDAARTPNLATTIGTTAA